MTHVLLRAKQFSSYPVRTSIYNTSDGPGTADLQPYYLVWHLEC